AESLRIEDLADTANMSVSALHHQFKAVTATSPLQYQKELRLREARRLMLVEMLDAASAGSRVGYESPSQFSREYYRLFGRPPMRDITSLRGLLYSGASADRGSPGSARGLPPAGSANFAPVSAKMARANTR
ncbi:MAG: helix-turn-helix domain-containing protein, partial [Burkholderiales bacterium]